MMSDSLGQEAVQLLQFKKKGSLELTNTEGRKSAQQLKKKKSTFFGTEALLLKTTYLKGLVQVSLCMMKSYLSSSL